MSDIPSMSSSSSMSPADFHSFFDVVPAPVALLDSDFCFVDLNLAFKTRVCSPATNLIGEYSLGIFQPMPKYAALLTSNRLTTGEVSSAQVRCLVNASGLNSINADIRIAAINDIDNRQYLLTLDEVDDDSARQPTSVSRNDLFQSLINQSSMSISVQDSNYNFTIVNDAYCRLVGYSAQELLGRDPIDLLHPPEQARLLVEQRGKLLDVAPSALPGFSRPREILHRSGRRVQFRLELVCVKGPDGSSLWCSTLIDPTTSDHLSVSDKALADANPDAVFVLDLEQDRMVHSNRAGRSLMGLLALDRGAEHRQRGDHPIGVQSGEQSSDQGLALLYSKVRFEAPAQFEMALRTSSSTSEHWGEVIETDGQARCVRIRVFPSQTSAAQRLIVAEDVTESRQRERNRLAEEIEHRKILVRETHHRIKNNLQGVAGLIERASYRDPALKSGLDNVILQIRSIATVHGLQIESDNRVDIVLLARAVSESIFKIFGSRVTVSAKSVRPNLRWGIDEHNAVPVALALSELLTNATKYSTQRERVRIAIESEHTRTVIRISNTGSLPQWFNYLHGAELLGGLKLIKALLPRDGCELEFIQEHGQVIAQLELCPPAIAQFIGPAVAEIDP
jgi:PAS domain S-box-containing protein